MHDSDIKAMRARFGVPMERLVSELRGIPCIEIADISPPRKQIMSSRSFGERITKQDDLENAMAFHATKIGRQLRKQESVAGMVHVFLETDPFRKDRPQYHSYISLPLVEPTSSTVEINRYAMIGLHRIYKSGYEYRKAGVCVSELSPESLFFPDMFADSRQERIMKVMDEINGQFGNGALRLSQDDWMHRYWEPRKERMSPRYTTSWNELAVCGD
ncbi:DUF4113 domain-containing protein [Oxalobacter aliiformigenes]|uniref:DUF4113 domain-containing protein n=1 Tax=Oxalobacter aliiformigenes TaxID=2946593 RepID=A0A9E9NTU0_9BURK|nr:DUF4113 domain-containing protein [Oxalobacter aliiformigenes]WAV90917.1 DUF4113 domain-containing protein [Oxalobacter aliiformigenes]